MYIYVRICVCLLMILQAKNLIKYKSVLIIVDEYAMFQWSNGLSVRMSI